jgi:Secretion system C-terminal sorting domain
MVRPGSERYLRRFGFIYSVVGTSNGCASLPKTITIKSNALPGVRIIEPDTSICNNGSVTLHADGAISYNWSPATGLNISNGPTVIATPAVTTDYIVKGVAANGCSKNDTVRIAVLPAIVPSVSISNTGCPSNTLIFQASSSNGGTNPQYQWFVNDVSAGMGPTFTLSSATNNTKVRCRLTSNADCTVSPTAEDSIVVNCIITAVSDIDGLEEFHVSPNPTPDQINVYIRVSQAKKVSYELFSSTGTKLYSFGPTRISGSNTHQIDLSKFLHGFYFLKVKIDKQELISKVIKIN